MVNLQTKIAGISLNNPLFLASGTCGYGREMAELFNLNNIGGIMIKGTTLEPRMGNNTPRIAEMKHGMLNSVGLQNPGVDAVIANELPFLRQYNLSVLANVGGNTVEEYCRAVEKFSASGLIHGFEINISCPNVKHGGIGFGVLPDKAAEVTEAVKKCTDKPVFMKLSPNVRDIAEIAVAVEQAGADGITLINTLTGMKIDIERKKPLLDNITGGVSGPAVMPIAVRMVYEVYRQVKIPIIGMGGISTGQDAIEFMMAGASAFAVGAAALVNPYAPINILRELTAWLDAHNYANITDIVGLAHKA